MARELLIVRHAEAAKNNRVEDRRRALKNKGKRGAQRLGVWLDKNDLRPDRVLSSPAVRAMTTAEKCCKSARLSADMVHPDARIYAASTPDLCEVLRDVSEAATRVLLVGHTPSVDDLVGYLCPSSALHLALGAVAHLRIEGPWRRLDGGCGVLLNVVAPDSLPRLFPFPDAHGPQQRPRPAYYYRQTSVVPFRRTADGLEVLIISSSHNKHGVIPKGIHDPGLSGTASAAREAFEEAGVEGRVFERVIGTYRYAKWGATCEVEVYPMEVSRELPECDWSERHRGRQWLSLKAARAMVKNDDVKRIIAALPKALAEAKK